MPNRIILLFSSWLLISGCSLLEIQTTYVPKEKKQWQRKVMKEYPAYIVHHYGYYYTADSISIYDETNHGNAISGGPPFIPVIPNFFLPFIRDSNDIFLHLSFRRNDEGITAEHITFKGIKDSIIHPVYQYSYRDSSGNSYVSLKTHGLPKKFTVIFNSPYSYREIVLRRKSYLVYTPFFVN